MLRALELDQYKALSRHVPGFVARYAGMSLEDEARFIAALAAAKQIRKRNDKWVVNRVLTVDTRPNEEENRRVKEHWAGVGLERLRSGTASPHALFSYNLFAIGARDYERIRRLHLEHFERVRNIIAESCDADRVVLMNLQLVPLGAADNAASDDVNGS